MSIDPSTGSETPKVITAEDALKAAIVLRYFYGQEVSRLDATDLNDPVSGVEPISEKNWVDQVEAVAAGTENVTLALLEVIHLAEPFLPYPSED